MHLRYPTVAQMLEELDSNDLNFWLSMDRHRTIGDIATIEMIAKLIAVIAAGHGVKSKFSEWVPWEVEEEEIETDPESTLHSMPGGAGAMQSIVDELAAVQAYKEQHGDSSESRYRDGGSDSEGGKGTP